MTDEQRYDQILDSCPSSKTIANSYDPDELERSADSLEAEIASGKVTRSPESDPDSTEYQGFDYVFELRSIAVHIRFNAKR